MGVGIVDPKSRLHVHGDYLVVSERGADETVAAALLSSMPPNSTIVGSPNDAELVFYWKGQDDKRYRGTITGTELTQS